jgi:CRISPR-associated endonuclease/helicase Cas3
LCAESQDDFRIKIIQTVALIVNHHRNLPNFENLINTDELYSSASFLTTHNLPFSQFMSECINQTFNNFSNEFDIKIFNRIFRYNPIVHERIWQNNALNYFMDTQFAFASLIHADKRDAANNVFYQEEENIENSVIQINNALKKSLTAFSKKSSLSELNKYRTAIRNEAVENASRGIAEGKRVFTLTAPTGAGKTIALLSIANMIQSQQGNYGIIYSLPFLSITEQVENILKQMGIDYIAINSKSQNKEAETLYEKYENNPTYNSLQDVLKSDFAEQTFDHPFIVTTFVQFFETLISNRNSTLLKLPNFAKKIFLIDEIQSLPPRLYIFFSAWLDAFCHKNDSYAVLSTATMPKLNFPNREFQLPIDKSPEKLFTNYSNRLPKELCNPEKFFNQDVFNRYKIEFIGKEGFYMENLVEHIQAQEKSCLIILNTIADTKQLYTILKDSGNVILLNTHFIPEDRNNKIEIAKSLLSSEERVILISTQLIEAGVDIDFPIVYRDFCPLPNLIQSAGRCNRNKSKAFGQVFFFKLQKEHGLASSEVVYRNEASPDFLKFCQRKITGEHEEKELFSIQSEFFDFIRDNLSIGSFVSGNENANMIECVNKAMFETLGNFKLINDNFFGEQLCYYIPVDEEDNSYEQIVCLMKESLGSTDFQRSKLLKIRMDMMLKKMSSRMLNVRVNRNTIAPAYSNEKEYFDIRVLADLNQYSAELGLNLQSDNLFL